MAKILLVEDDPLNREIVSRFLHGNNLQVVTANDGPEGVTLARSEQPDLILMDWMLPESEDGQKATCAIRASRGLETVPIIAVSALAMSHEVEEMRQAGCTAVLVKPLNLDKLLENITSLLAAGCRDRAKP
jgi:two-component system cell cycle response regulator DivK